jgi:hypothetical protein
MSTDHIIRWRFSVETFGPTILHIKGEKNVIADILSRLDANSNEKIPVNPTDDNRANLFYKTVDKRNVLH